MPGTTLAAGTSFVDLLALGVDDFLLDLGDRLEDDAALRLRESLRAEAQAAMSGEDAENFPSP